MHRRYFEHVYAEICVAVNLRIPRYDLWLLLGDDDGTADELTLPQARYFVENHLSAVLAESGGSISDRARRRLEKSILQFDPHHPTPEEWLTRTFERATEQAENTA